MAELADALDLGSSIRKDVGVRLPSLAPILEKGGQTKPVSVLGNRSILKKRQFMIFKKIGLFLLVNLPILCTASENPNQVAQAINIEWIKKVVNEHIDQQPTPELKRYFEKKFDLTVHSEKGLNAILESLQNPDICIHPVIAIIKSQKPLPANVRSYTSFKAPEHSELAAFYTKDFYETGKKENEIFFNHINNPELFKKNYGSTHQMMIPYLSDYTTCLYELLRKVIEQSNL